MPYLECFKTTEAGEDEIYIVISGRSSDGQSFKARLPNDAGHWDLNDGEGDPPVLNQDLMRFDMAEGSSLDFTVMVLEEDGGTIGGWTNLAGGALTLVDQGLGELIGVIGELFNFKDSDDFIGAVAVHIEMTNGQALATFKPLDRVEGGWDTSSYWLKRPVSMNGDGSSYQMVFEVK